MARECAKGLLLITLLMVRLVGCGQLVYSHKGALVRHENWIPLAEGVNQTAIFQTRELPVVYNYSRSESDVHVAGSIRFDDSLRYNFTSLRNFRLGALFLDFQWYVLADRGIENQPFGHLDRLATSDVCLELLEGTASMAFG
jgi:hypothetical protein